MEGFPYRLWPGLSSRRGDLMLRAFRDSLAYQAIAGSSGGSTEVNRGTN